MTDVAAVKRISRLAVVGVLILAALLAPIALPVRMYVEWIRRKKVAIERVVDVRQRTPSVAPTG